MEHKLFGWAKDKEGNTVCVSDVPKGFACNCFCPYCNAPLQARKGQIRKHHFAHKQGMECQYGYEASVHLLAKEVFLKTKTLQLPRFALQYESNQGKERILIHNSRKNKNRTLEIHDDELTDLMRVYAPYEGTFYADDQHRPPIYFDDVIIEQFRGDVKPDAIAIKAGNELFVEFMFSHAVDDEKYKKLAEANAKCVEIDLSNINLQNNRDADFIMMAKYLTNETNIRWIYYPEAIEKIRKKLNEKREHHEDALRRNRSRRTHQRTYTKQIKPTPIGRTYFPSAFNKFDHQTNCDYILNRVEKGGKDVCDYVKRLRNTGGLPWEDIYFGWRQECRNCPNHRIVSGKIFCERYTNYI